MQPLQYNKNNQNKKYFNNKIKKLAEAYTLWFIENGTMTLRRKNTTKEILKEQERRKQKENKKENKREKKREKKKAN